MDTGPRSPERSKGLMLAERRLSSPLSRSSMSRLNRLVVVAAFAVSVSALAQSVTVHLPAPPMPTVQVVVPAPAVVVQPAPAQVVVQQRTVYVEPKGNRGKHKGQFK